MKPLEKLPINCLWVVEMSVFTICLKFIWTFCRCYLCRKSNGNNLRVQRQKVLFQISDTTRRNTSLPPSLPITFNNFVRNRQIKSPLWMAWLLNCIFIFCTQKSAHSKNRSSKYNSKCWEIRVKMQTNYRFWPLKRVYNNILNWQQIKNKHLCVSIFFSLSKFTIWEAILKKNLKWLVCTCITCKFKIIYSLLNYDDLQINYDICKWKNIIITLILRYDI